MTIRVGINGFGRIGRNFWRAVHAAGGQAHAAGDDGAEVGENITEKIAGHNHVEGFRLAHEIHGGGVHQQRMRLHIGIILRHIAVHFIP